MTNQKLVIFVLLGAVFMQGSLGMVIHKIIAAKTNALSSGVAVVTDTVGGIYGQISHIAGTGLGLVGLITLNNQHKLIIVFLILS